jgi:hypothetical protein
MLLPKDVHPMNSLYFNGAYIIKALRDSRSMGFMDLYLATKELRDMPIAIFVLALDWLFLAAVVRNNHGHVELCS